MSLTEFGSTVWLNWIDLDIEYDEYCAKDWLKVYDASNDEVYGG